MKQADTLAAILHTLRVMQEQTVPRDAFGLPEVAQRLGIGETLAKKLPRMGLPTFKVGGRVLVRRQDLDAWLAEQVGAAAVEQSERAAEIEATFARANARAAARQNGKERMR